MAQYSQNTTLKVNRAITGATTVNANCYAVVSYNCSFSATGQFTSGLGLSPVPIVRYFGAGQTIPASFGSAASSSSGAGGNSSISATYSLLSGVEFINTP